MRKVRSRKMRRSYKQSKTPILKSPMAKSEIRRTKMSIGYYLQSWIQRVCQIKKEIKAKLEHWARKGNKSLK